MPQKNQNKPNRLINEKSPYLLQHAYNPVDWFPWGEEAFEKARQEDKPIFLSIGYSTCHWCHVMEHESFEDSAVAKLMNDAFVSIKVDREERPDIDNIYMTVCQMMTGSGGWPMTIIMTPDKKPFFAGTYFPKENRMGRIGMIQLVPKIMDAWKNKRSEILESSEQIIEALHKSASSVVGNEIGNLEIENAVSQFIENFDETYGGFSGAPKFPTPHNLTFLIRQWKKTKDRKLLNMVEKTLTEMRKGGMYDHIGFGFHRYSTDAKWLVPHFEKMLYDQALLADAYIEAFQITQNDFYKQSAEEIFSYILRDMTSKDGGFYSAEDADSEGEEGKFYLWTTQEIRNLLSTEESDLIIKVFNLNDDGNWEDQVHGIRPPNNIFHLQKTIKDWSEELNVPAEKLNRRLEEIRIKLFNTREKRIHPLKDDKILTDWNGLMIAALAKGGKVFGEKKYITAAKHAIEFILTKLQNAKGELIHRYRDGEASLTAHIDDYAFFINGLLELYEAGFDINYLQQAIDLNKLMIEQFWDEQNGGFYFTADKSEKLIVRQKDIYDGATPSGNSVAMMNLLRLGRITGDTELEIKAENLSKAFSNTVSRYAAGYSRLLSSVDFSRAPSHEIVIVGDPNTNETRNIINELSKRFIPNKIVLFKNSVGDNSQLTEIAPFTEFQTSIDGKATVYVCKNYVCNLPVTNVEKMFELMGEK